MNETLMGQLIAEIAKFGGMDKKQSSQLARILLPHIIEYGNQRELEGRMDELNLMCKAEDHMEDFNTPEYPYAFSAQQWRELRSEQIGKTKKPPEGDSLSPNALNGLSNYNIAKDLSQQVKEGES